MGNKLTDFMSSINPFSSAKEVKAVEIKSETQNSTKNRADIPLPPGRVSQNEYIGFTTLEKINDIISILQGDFQFEVIPVIRKLCKVNPDMSQALTDLVQLANTGHKIKFDPGVSAQQQEAMRYEIEQASRNWADGVAGNDGLVNKMIAQIMIGGAISNEWVPSLRLSAIDNLVFLNPENIRWGYNKKTQRYDPYQKVQNGIINNGEARLNYIPLNKNTYKYFGLNSDSDLPYGNPPYLAALDPVSTQKYMNDNIKFIVETLGLMGYLDVTIEKPEMQDGESDKAYQDRLESLLSKAADRVKKGFRDGINVGFKDDHEFEFHSTTKGSGNIEALFSQNELQVASGLKYDSAFLGRGSTTETMVTILFTKMLSQLTNIQNLVKENLEYGYSLHLKLKGFKFKYLDVEFNKSTITDDLKYQQAMEIKGRILRVLRMDGIISQDQYADGMGYKKPYQQEPVVPFVVNQDPGGVQKKQKREDGKDRSDRKGTDKKKPQGTINDRSKKV
jgi:hypothetical protein